MHINFKILGTSTSRTSTTYSPSTSCWKLEEDSSNKSNRGSFGENNTRNTMNYDYANPFYKKQSMWLTQLDFENSQLRPPEFTLLSW